MPQSLSNGTCLFSLSDSLKSYCPFILNGPSNMKIVVLLWEPPWDPGDVFKSFFDDFSDSWRRKKVVLPPTQKSLFLALVGGL